MQKTCTNSWHVLQKLYNLVFYIIESITMDTLYFHFLKIKLFLLYILFHLLYYMNLLHLLSRNFCFLCHSLLLNNSSTINLQEKNFHVLFDLFYFLLSIKLIFAQLIHILFFVFNRLLYNLVALE